MQNALVTTESGDLTVAFSVFSSLCSLLTLCPPCPLWWNKQFSISWFLPFSVNGYQLTMR